MIRCDPDQEASMFLLLCIRPSAVTSSFHAICVVWALQFNRASWNNLRVRHPHNLFIPTPAFLTSLLMLHSKHWCYL
jgi:hypothetical protein